MALALLALGALAAALLVRRDRAALLAGTIGAVSGCLIGTVAAIGAVFETERPLLSARWDLPLGELCVGIDPLSALFLIGLFLVSGLAALYAAGSLRPYLGKRRLAWAVVLFNLLIISIAGVVLARNGVMFLLSWEVMSITSFFLVNFENDREDVRRGGTTYLIASHAGVLFLFAVFAVMAHAAGSFGFAELAQADLSGVSNLVFALALVGFGTKAGFWPVHTWAPDAYPAAPSHVSSVMSGVMSKMGIYGLLRVLTFLGPPPAWWGLTLILVGAISGIWGVLHALAQHDLKRVLAYSSVENLGIIALGLGLGLLAQSQGHATVAILGFGGALLHVLNHGLFKGLLFQAAASVRQGAGTRDLRLLGGLSRRMPFTAFMFLFGALAISGLPPLNGFVSEWLIYLGAFRGGATLSRPAVVGAVLILPALALIGGLATACFVRAFATVFLGQARSPAPDTAQEATLVMRVPMATAAVLCLGIALFPAGGLALVAPAVSVLGVRASAAPSLGLLPNLTVVFGVFLLLVGSLVLLRRRLLRGRTVAENVTWGCAYPHPSARVQYSAPSFSDPVLWPFVQLLQFHRTGQAPEGIFPSPTTCESRVGDMAGERVLVPAWRRFLHSVQRLKVVQHGRMQLYLVYVLCTLVALVVWQLSGFLSN